MRVVISVSVVKFLCTRSLYSLIIDNPNPHHLFGFWGIVITRLRSSIGKTWKGLLACTYTLLKMSGQNVGWDSSMTNDVYACCRNWSCRRLRRTCAARLRPKPRKRRDTSTTGWHLSRPKAWVKVTSSFWYINDRNRSEYKLAVFCLVKTLPAIEERHNANIYDQEHWAGSCNLRSWSWEVNRMEGIQCDCPA